MKRCWVQLKIHWPIHQRVSKFTLSWMRRKSISIAKNVNYFEMFLPNKVYFLWSVRYVGYGCAVCLSGREYVWIESVTIADLMFDFYAFFLRRFGVPPWSVYLFLPFNFIQFKWMVQQTNGRKRRRNKRATKPNGHTPRPKPKSTASGWHEKWNRLNVWKWPNFEC